MRRELNSDVDASGRLFLYYLAGITGDGGREVSGTGYVVTTYGFIYKDAEPMPSGDLQIAETPVADETAPVVAASVGQP